MMQDQSKAPCGYSLGFLHTQRACCPLPPCRLLLLEQKGRLCLQELLEDYCSAMSVQQVYRLCTTFCDDKELTGNFPGGWVPGWDGEGAADLVPLALALALPRCLPQPACCPCCLDLAWLLQAPAPAPAPAPAQGYMSTTSIRCPLPMLLVPPC